MAVLVGKERDWGEERARPVMRHTVSTSEPTKRRGGRWAGETSTGRAKVDDDDEGGAAADDDDDDDGAYLVKLKWIKEVKEAEEEDMVLSEEEEEEVAKNSIPPASKNRARLAAVPTIEREGLKVASAAMHAPPPPPPPPPSLALFGGWMTLIP